jgi:hypothetical protein
MSVEIEVSLGPNNNPTFLRGNVHRLLFQLNYIHKHSFIFFLVEGLVIDFLLVGVPSNGVVIISV